MLNEKGKPVRRCIPHTTGKCRNRIMHKIRAITGKHEEGERLLCEVVEYIAEHYDQELAFKLLQIIVATNANKKVIPEEEQKIFKDAIEYARTKVNYSPYEIRIGATKKKGSLYHFSVLMNGRLQGNPIYSGHANLKQMLLVVAEFLNQLENDLSYLIFGFDYKCVRIRIPFEQYSQEDKTIKELIDKGVIEAKDNYFILPNKIYVDENSQLL